MSLVADKPSWLTAALDKPVAVWGRGVSGRAAGKLIERLGGEVTYYDEAPDSCHFGIDAANESELVITSPGFASDHEWVAMARDQSCRLVGEIDFASLFWDGPIIAVTGTNGKTTLTEFLFHAFSHAGMEVHMGGNVGTPLSELIANVANTESVAICEMSSFQAETIQHLNADYVVWTNFDEDHLDRHRTMRAYFDAKYKLVEKGNSPKVFYDRSVAEWASRLGYELDDDGLVSEVYDLKDVVWKETAFDDSLGKLCFRLAHAVWNAWGLDLELLLEAARSFRKSPHRMESLGAFDGVFYWNDSKATNFHATLGAIGGIEGDIRWIGGGKSKGGDIAGFALKLLPQLKSVYLIGETKFELQTVFREHGLEAPVYDSLDLAVSAVRSEAQVGDHVVFSPGFASFDMFDGYVERGDLFKKAVAEF